LKYLAPEQIQTVSVAVYRVLFEAVIVFRRCIICM